jgi:hypothetical protein
MEIIMEIPESYPDNNPKSIVGATKPQLQLVPASAIIGMSTALQNGGEKYGYFNYRQTKIAASVYMGASLRHLYAYYDGEDAAADTGLLHLDHAMAGLAIWRDALASGQLVDDRPVNGSASRMLSQLTNERTKRP